MIASLNGPTIATNTDRQSQKPNRRTFGNVIGLFVISLALSP
jgi:hypothetical protein